MRNQWLAPVAVAVLTSALAACSNDSGSSSSNTATVNVQVNQEDIRYGLVRSQRIAESGLPSTDFELQPLVSSVETDSNGLATVSVPTNAIHLFQLVGREADAGRDINGTSRRCQWVAGCANGVAFGDYYTITRGMEWRSVAYDLSSNELIRLTPLTELAAELGQQRIFVETFSATPGDQQNYWDYTGFYSPHAVVQSVSQVSKLFGIDDIQTREPADLSELNQWGGGDSAGAQQSIRYGAILAAWQKQSQDYVNANPGLGSLAQAVAQELVNNNGQLMQAGNSQTLSLAQLFTDAADNLEAAPVSDTSAAARVSAVLNQLRSDVSGYAANPDVLTAVIPETLANLIGQTEADELALGIERSKAFLALLRDYQNTFFESGYKDRIDTYVDDLKEVGTAQQASFNSIVDAFVKTKQLYVECLQAAGNCPSHSGEPGWEWLTAASFSNRVLTINDGQIRVTQAVADVNPTDSDDSPSQSQAIDLLITGRYEQDGLVFNIDHTYTDADARDDISVPSGIRIFYPTAVSDIQTNAEELAYEIRWADFQLKTPQFTINDPLNPNNGETIAAAEIEGAFSQFYIGVLDPDNNAAERRYNIENVVLNARISDVLDDDNDSDKRYTVVNVSARSNNADTFYPEKTFAAFNGFLSQRTSSVYVEGHSEAELVSYQFGQEQVAGYATEHFDFIVPLGESKRYRFYPERVITDENDLDGDGDRKDKITIHDFEQCDLVADGDSWSVSRCDGKERLLGERDIADSLNQLWQVGILSRVNIDNRGQYFVSWPTANDADFGQCLVLDELTADGSRVSMPGTLYEPAVLGLNTLRFNTQVSLNDSDSTTADPDTLLDVSLSLISPDNYQVSAALSHDYSATATSGGVVVGQGADLDQILLGYNTRGDIAESGSLTIYKDGVSLNVAGDNDATVDSTLVASLRKTTSADPLPYTFVTNDEGKFERCVLRNEATFEDASTLEDAIIPLYFRGVVYGSIRKENGIWIARFVNGEFQSLL